MKNIFFFCICAIYIQVALTQNLGYDNKWVFGYTGLAGPKSSGTIIDFSQTPFVIDSTALPFLMEAANTSISDTMGNLLFYSNGIKIGNKNHEIMEGGDTLSPCQLTFDNYIHGMNTPNGILTIPNSKQPNIYYLFHYNYLGAFEPPQNPFYGCSHLLCTTIDMSYNNGLGKVIEKNVPIISSPLTWGCIQAVKHANGHDWWLIIPEYTTRYYHRVLIDETGIHYEGKQLAGPNITIPSDWDPSLAKFSQQGDKYVRFRPPFEAYYFHFDRCTGLLSDVQTIPLDLTYTTGDIEFSPDGNLLYVSNVDTIFQLDLNASNIAASKTVVAVYDGFQSPFGSTFNLAKLAPDGKIYLNCTNGENVMHIIENPNVLGVGCNVNLHGLHLPNYNAASIPNHPNYHLGAMSCDTTVSYQSEVSSEQIAIYPNPAQGFVYVDIGKAQGGFFTLYDLSGKEILQQAFVGGNAKIMLGKLPKGVYFYRISDNNKQAYGKLLVE